MDNHREYRQQKSNSDESIESPQQHTSIKDEPSKEKHKSHRQKLSPPETSDEFYRQYKQKSDDEERSMKKRHTKESEPKSTRKSSYNPAGEGSSSKSIKNLPEAPTVRHKSRTYVEEQSKKRRESTTVKKKTHEHRHRASLSFPSSTPEWGTEFIVASHWRLIRKVGSGSFGDIYYGKSLDGVEVYNL